MTKITTMIRTLVGVMLVQFCTASNVNAAHTDASLLSPDIAAILEQQKLTGAVWSLVDGDHISFASTGLANAEQKTPLTPDAHVQAGSITKTLLATGILRLATQGHIDLDAPVYQYTRAAPIHNSWASLRHVTTRHLLDHTAGFDDAHLWHLFSTKITPDTSLTSAFHRSPEVLTTRFQPGTQISYSNAGYALLGMIVEAVTGERYEEYLDRNLLTPLGMHDSTFHFATQSGAGADAKLAWGHTDGGQLAQTMPIMFRPAGQFTTTAADMARFARFLMSDGTIDGETFIDPELMAARGLPHSTDAKHAGLAVGYGLGMNTNDRFGALGRCHSGNIIGYVAQLCIYPDEQKAFFISVNTDSENADYQSLFARVAKELNLKQQTAPDSDLPLADANDWEGHYILSPSRFESFRYFDVLMGFSSATWRQGNLIFKPFGGSARALRPVGDHLLSAEDRTLASHILLRDDEGNPLISDGFRTYAKTNASLIYGLWVSLLLGTGGMLWFLVHGGIAYARLGKQAIKKPEGIAFLGVVSLALPVPLFLLQSYMSLGDLTAASAMLAATSLAMPLSMLIAHTRIVKTNDRSRLETFHGFATIAVVQFCLILWYWDLLPLMLWK